MNFVAKVYHSILLIAPITALYGKTVYLPGQYSEFYCMSVLYLRSSLSLFKAQA